MKSRSAWVHETPPENTRRKEEKKDSGSKQVGVLAHPVILIPRRLSQEDCLKEAWSAEQDLSQKTRRSQGVGDANTMGYLPRKAAGIETNWPTIESRVTEDTNLWACL